MMTPFEFISTIAALAHPNENLIIDYIEESLEPKYANLMREHLHECRSCRDIAESLGLEANDAPSAEVLPFPTRANAVAEARSDPAQRSSSLVTVREQVRYVPDKLAAADRRSSGARPDVQHLEPIFGMTDGNVTLNFCDIDGADSVVVDGAEDQPAQVMLGDNLFEVSAGAPGRPRLVVGLTRQRITLFIAGGQGVFKIIYK